MCSGSSPAFPRWATAQGGDGKGARVSLTVCPKIAEMERTSHVAQRIPTGLMVTVDRSTPLGKQSNLKVRLFAHALEVSGARGESYKVLCVEASSVLCTLACTCMPVDQKLIAEEVIESYPASDRSIMILRTGYYHEA